MFNIADKIVHPIHGAGIISKIITKTIDDEDVNYYEVDLIHSNMTIFVPVKTNLAIGIRHVSSKDVIMGLMENSKSELQAFELNWNKRYRDNMLKIRTGEFLEVAVVAKSLQERSEGQTLSTGEKKMLDSTKHILSSEMALSLDIDYEDAKIKLSDLLRFTKEFANI